METKTKIEIPKGEYRELKIADIVMPADCNPRQAEPQGQLFGLRNSLEEIGQLNAVTISQVDDKYYVVAGRRRIEAAKQAGQETIEAKVYKNLDHRTFLLMLAVENVHRRDFNVLEQASLMQMMNDSGYHEKAIAAKLGMNIDTVRRKMNLLKLPDEVKQMITRENHPLPIHQAGMLLNLGQSQQIEMARRIAPKTGPVAGEEQAKQMLEELKGSKLPLDHSDPADKLPSRAMKKRQENKKGTLRGVESVVDVREKTKNSKQEKTGIKPPKVRKPTDDIRLGEICLDIIGTGVMAADGSEIIFAKTTSFFKFKGKEVVCDEPMRIFFDIGSRKNILKNFQQTLAAKPGTKGDKTQSKKNIGNV